MKDELDFKNYFSSLHHIFLILIHFSRVKLFYKVCYVDALLYSYDYLSIKKKGGVKKNTQLGHAKYTENSGCDV